MYIIVLRTNCFPSSIINQKSDTSLMLYLTQKYIMAFLFTDKKRQATKAWDGTTEVVWEKTMLYYDSKKTGYPF